MTQSTERGEAMSDTPRTDAETRQGKLFVGNNTYLATFKPVDGAQDGWVPAEHSRTLEREAERLTKERDDKARWLKHYQERTTAAESALSDLRDLALQAVSTDTETQGIYLASPYTHPDPTVMHARYEYVQKALHHLLEKKEWAYSPIVMCHPLAQRFTLPVDHEYWLDFDRTMIRLLPRFMVLRIDGWNVSKGVKSEIEFATSLGRIVEWL